MLSTFYSLAIFSRYAAGKIGKLEGLSDLQIKEFIKKAKVAWGNDVATWTVAQLNEAGNLLSKCC